MDRTVTQIRSSALVVVLDCNSGTDLDLLDLMVPKSTAGRAGRALFAGRQRACPKKLSSNHAYVTIQVVTMQFDKTHINADKAEPCSQASESNIEQGELTDTETQEKYRAAYLEQLRRLSCPGCGDSEFFG
jgi:hypothetical protein